MNLNGMRKEVERLREQLAPNLPHLDGWCVVNGSMTPAELLDRLGYPTFAAAWEAGVRRQWFDKLTVDEWRLAHNLRSYAGPALAHYVLGDTLDGLPESLLGYVGFEGKCELWRLAYASGCAGRYWRPWFQKREQHRPHFWTADESALLNRMHAFDSGRQMRFPGDALAPPADMLRDAALLIHRRYPAEPGGPAFSAPEAHLLELVRVRDAGEKHPSLTVEGVEVEILGALRDVEIVAICRLVAGED